jgi:hypothetical protein
MKLFVGDVIILPVALLCILSGHGLSDPTGCADDQATLAVALLLSFHVYFIVLFLPFLFGGKLSRDRLMGKKQSIVGLMVNKILDYTHHFTYA